GQAQNDVDLGGQRALVTGGGRGIGRAIAVALAAAGARVAVLARTRSQVQAVATELASHGAQGRAVTADVGDPQQVTEAVAGLEAAWGGIDILVNNAGALGAVGLAHQTDAEAWLQTVRVNLGGCYLCCRAVLPGMIDRGRGSIVNLSGGGAFDPRPRFSAYGAAKAGVVRFTET
ncbi:MAG: SDR family NAD(P)-dependent oxidoreductase, partial [Pirellulaceae bacterium]|nr:SDR family NAD(P)-dependent oxidoreductase [Pirellulaceae bacterium]